MERTEVVSIRLSPQEKRALMLLAQHDQRSPSEWVREMIRREAARQGIWPVELVPEPTP